MKTKTKEQNELDYEQESFGSANQIEITTKRKLSTLFFGQLDEKSNPEFENNIIEAKNNSEEVLQSQNESQISQYQFFDNENEDEMICKKKKLIDFVEEQYQPKNIKSGNNAEISLIKKTKNNYEDKKWHNSHSFSERPNTLNKKWDEIETNKFYQLLELFGTDFSIIQQFLKSKTVQQIKNKFNKEEKENKMKIKQILINAYSNSKQNSQFSIPNEEEEKLNFLQSPQKDYTQQEKDIENKNIKQLSNSTNKKIKSNSEISINEMIEVKIKKIVSQN